MARDQDDIAKNAAAQAAVSARAPASSNLLAADLLIVDTLVNIPSATELARGSDNLRDRYKHLDDTLGTLLAKKGLHPGDKISITEDEFKTLSLIVAGLPSKMEAGGSSADILTTVKNLHGSKVNVDFLGIAGNDSLNDQIILGDLKKSNIHVDPGETPGARCATSFIFTHPDGKRSVLTYPGNAADKLRASMVTDERIAQSDSVFIPISLWSKLESALPEALFKKALEQDKQIIVAIPKQAKFNRSGSDDLYQRLIPNADVIIADEEELAKWYKTGDNYALAVQNLQTDLALRDRLRAAQGKPPKTHAATALIKHADYSATVLIAPSPPGITPPVAAAAYKISAPIAAAGKKATLGADDAMYAGFLAGLNNNLPPQKAGEFAMDVAQTKFLYDTVRIPSPVGADKKTREQWNDLRSGMDDALAGLESAIGLARTGVSNAASSKLPRTQGQKVFDLMLYPLVANIGVFALSMFVTYHSNFNQDKANFFVARSTWFKKKLSKLPFLSKSPESTGNLNMVVWSFVDGSAMVPVVAAVESKRQKISRWLDDKMDTTPDDTSVYDKETHRSWADVIKARATTFGLVLATYFTFNAKLFPHSTKEGILHETAPNSGVFKRDTVKSLNGFAFYIPGRKIGDWLYNMAPVRTWALKKSEQQLKNLAQNTGTVARNVTETDARYQIEGLANTGLFEAVYTSLCTAGLYFLGKIFAAKREKNQIADAASQSPNAPSSSDQNEPLHHTTAAMKETPKLHHKKELKKSLPEKNTSYIDAIETRRDTAPQIRT